MRTYEENHALNLTLPQPNGARTRAYLREERPPEFLTETSRIKFYGDPRWWKVRAANKRFVVLTRPDYFGRPEVYTIVSWEQGRRGSHDSWAYGAGSDKDCRKMIKALKKGKIQLSERRTIYLAIKEIDL